MPNFSDELDTIESALGPPRFSLRTMLVIVSALCCLFAVMSAVGTVWSIVLLFCLSLVMAHVLGNSLGTRLRDRASRRTSFPACSRAGLSHTQEPFVIFSPSRLAERSRLNRVTHAIALAGAIAGGLLGGTGLAVISPSASIGAVMLGIVSSAILGAFAGFLASSFISVARAALREALGAGESSAEGGAAVGS